MTDVHLIFEDELDDQGGICALGGCSPIALPAIALSDEFGVVINRMNTAGKSRKYEG